MDLEMLQFFGQYGALGVFAWIMFKRQNSQLDTLMTLFTNSMEDTARCLKSISNNVGRTQLNEVQTITIFKSILNEHIDRKADYAQEILFVNDIHKREVQIKKDLKSKFVQITKEEADKLSYFNTPAGDLGAILCSIDFVEFMEKVYAIFFSDTKVELKIKDLKAMMREYVNNLVEVVSCRIADNKQ